MVRGSLAPDGAVIKISAASAELLRHRGPGGGVPRLRRHAHQVDDPDLPVTPDSVLVLAGCGPVGARDAGVGHVPIPARLSRRA